MHSKTKGPALWLAIFLIGAAFQFWRHSQVDTLIYIVVALMVVAALQNRIRIPEFAQTSLTFSVATVLVSAMIFLIFPIHSWLVAAFYLGLIPILAKICWQGNLGQTGGIDRGMMRSAQIWTVIGLLICVCELGNYLASDYTHNDKRYSTLTVLFDPVLADRWGKVLFIILWAGIGVGLLRVTSAK